MKITRVSPYTGKTNEMEINVTQEQIDQWRAGTLIQKAMPHLTPAEREFIKTGYTPADWKEMFEGGNEGVHGN